MFSIKLWLWNSVILMMGMWLVVDSVCFICIKWWNISSEDSGIIYDYYG